MKKIIYLVIIIFLIGCADNKSPKKSNENTDQKIDNLEKSKELYTRLFTIIDLNYSGKLPEAEFEPEAKSIKKSLDSLELLLTNTEKETLKKFSTELYDDLINKNTQR